MSSVLALTDPQSRALRRAAALRILADLLWPVQAMAVAQVIAGWLAGPPFGALWIAVFVLAGLARAAAARASGQRAFGLGQQIVARARAGLLDRETRRLGALSSAELAAMVAEKIPLLAPYHARFRLGMLRVRLVPVLFLAIVATQSWVVAVILAVAGPLIPLFMALVGLAAKEASARQMIEVGALNRMLIDRIAALPDLRLLDGFARSRRDFETRAEALRQRTMAVLRIAFLSSTVLELFAAIGVAMVAVYVGFSLLGVLSFGTWGGAMTVAQGIFLLLMAPEFFQPLRDLAGTWHDKAAAEAVAQELETLGEIALPPILGQGIAAAPLSGPVALRTVAAQVARGHSRVRVPDITLGAGDSLALTGPSGVGKSTALDALAGMLPLAEGQIEVCGLRLDDTQADGWRARVALVPQRVHLRDATLGALLDPHGDAGDPGPALARARADAIVAALPEGLNTRLGESGAGVSGGEARRLMLARAFLSGAEVILADEPTADLDTELAGQIIAALVDAARAGTMVIVATHDPALAAAMDHQIRLEPSGEALS